MQKTDRRVKWLEYWFGRYDKLFFDRYFSDKKVIIEINGRYSSTLGKAHGDGKIEIAESIFDEWSKDEVKDTLLHEMLHLFLYWTHADDTAWNDGSKIFKVWSKQLRCPVKACASEIISKKPIRIRTCIDCYCCEIVDDETRTRRCSFCGSLNTKVYNRAKKLKY